MRGIPITVTRQAAQNGEDAHGAPVIETITITVKGCAWAPGTSKDSREQFGTRTRTGGTVYAPKDAVFFPTDIVTIEGIDYTVDGEIGVWRSPFTGQIKGIEFAVQRGA